MTLPSAITSTKVKLSLPDRPAEFAGFSDYDKTGAGGDNCFFLSLNLQRQILSNWCWAAVAASIASFYNAKTRWTQCLLATTELPDLRGEDCCRDPDTIDRTSPCNSPWCLENALDRTGNLEKFVSVQISFKELFDQLADGRPVGCRVAFNGYLTHYIVITGVYRGLLYNWIETKDPSDQSKSYYMYDKFCEGYSYYTWTDTIFTKTRTRELWD